MRIIRFLILYMMVSVLGLMVLIFLALNHYTIQIDLVRAQYPVSIAWVMMGAALFGFVIALLLLLPGRLAAGLHVHALERDVRSLERLLVDREDLLEDQEDYIDEREELRARLIEQHEELLERHELILARHQELANDHDRVTAQRDEARAQLAALRIARPAAGHASSAATALRLLPQTAPDPVPVARPSTPVPAARRAAPLPVGRVAAPVAQSAAQSVAQAKPAQPAQRGRLQMVEATAVVEPAVEPTKELTEEPAAEAREAVETETESAPPTVPVVSPASAIASSLPTAAEPSAQETPLALETPPATPPTRRDFAAEARAGAARVQQSAEATLAHLRENTGRLWSEATAQVGAQGKAQAARLRGLRQRVTAGVASIRREQATLDAAPDDPSAE